MWNYKLSSKTKKNKNGDKKSSIWVFGSECWKTIVIFIIKINPPSVCLIAKFRAKIRILEFGTRNALFGCFGQQFRKTIAIFAILTLEFALLQNSVQKIKIFKLGTKNARFPYFGAGIWKCYCHIWSQRPRICLSIKFGAK